MRETATDETSEEQPGLPPAAPTGASSGTAVRRGWRLSGPRLLVAMGIIATTAALVVVVLISRDSSAPSPSVDRAASLPAITAVPDLAPTQAPPPSPSATPIPLALRREIEAAFDRFWRVRADAALGLDVSRLPEVAAGAALDVETRNVESLRAQGHAGRYVVTLQYGVVEATPTSAVVASRFENRSYVIDLQTRLPIAPTPAASQEVWMTYWLEKIDGRWKVIDGAVHQT